MPTIAIVGGGMVGISFALFLAKRLPDINLVLIEQFPLPTSSAEKDAEGAKGTRDIKNQLPPAPTMQASFDARSTAISAGSAALFDELGLWALIEKNAEAISTIHISDRGHYQGAQLQAQEYEVDALGYVVENSWLGQCLLYELQQSAVQCIAPATVKSCQFKQNEVLLHFDQNEQPTLSADLVIVADGADSPVCKAVGIDHQKVEYQQSAVITNIALKDSHNGFAYERFTDEGPLALLPLADYDNTHRASLVWTRNSDEVDNVMAMNDHDFLKALQKAFGYRAGQLIEVGKRQVHPLTRVTAEEQCRSRLLVAGNAAHFLHPVAGQGFNLSLRDGVALADILAQAHQAGEDVGQYKVLQRYQQQREQDQDITIALTHTMVKLFSSKKISLSLLRQFGLLNLNIHTKVKKTLAHQMMGFA